MKTTKKQEQTEEEAAFEIPLQRPYGRLTLGLIVTAFAGLFMLHEADTNVRGLIINGVIHLDPGQADVFYVVMSLFCLAGAVLVLLSLYALARSRQFRLKIDADEIRLPGTPLWKDRGEVAIPLAEVVGVEAPSPQAKQKPQHIVIVAQDGRFPLPVAWLPDGWSPEAVAQAVITRARRRAESP